jgi:protein O-GlcNAc transferase
MSDEHDPGTRRNDDILPLIQKGAALHQAGHLDAAAKIYTEILGRAPHDFDANHLLGVIGLQQGRLDVAQRLIGLALAIRPNDTSAISNLGVSYLRDGQLEPSLQWFDLAVTLQPDSPTALTNAAEVRYRMGRHGDAIALLERAHELDPSSYEACNLLGACLMELGDSNSAAEIFESATHLRPDDAGAWANLSAALQANGDDQQALECANRAAALRLETPRILDAPAKQPLAQRRHAAEASENGPLGVSPRTSTVDMILSYANALMSNGLNDAAVVELRRALTLEESNLTVRWALAMAHLKIIYESESDVVASRQAFGESLDEIKSWYAGTAGIEAAYKTVGTVQPFLLAYQNYNNRDLLKRYGALCATFMASFASRVSGARRLGQIRDTSPTLGKLRLGIVSAHVREHSVWTAITKGWVQNLDRDMFEIAVFHLSSTVDRETESVVGLVDNFDNRTKDLAGWVEAITARELDIALYPEIGSDPLTAKLASLRLAPVQAVTWGHPETSGLPTIDLYISAQAFEPVDAAENNYSEKLVMLPGLGVHVEPLQLPDTDLDLKSLKLPTDQPLLLCAGQPFKYAPQYDHVWLQIAKALQKRRLFRKSSSGRLVFFRSHNETWDRILEKRLRAAFARGGLDFDAHATILPFLDHSSFFGLMRKSTLMLDTLGFSGFNTALQGIECELPVLAFEGSFLRGRLASGILRELELPELVATDTSEFVQKAVELAMDPEKVRAIRGKIIARRATLFRNLSPVRALEQCFLAAAGRDAARSDET